MRSAVETEVVNNTDSDTDETNTEKIAEQKGGPTDGDNCPNNWNMATGTTAISLANCSEDEHNNEEENSEESPSFWKGKLITIRNKRRTYEKPSERNSPTQYPERSQPLTHEQTKRRIIENSERNNKRYYKDRDEPTKTKFRCWWHINNKKCRYGNDCWYVQESTEQDRLAPNQRVNSPDTTSPPTHIFTPESQIYRSHPPSVNTTNLPYPTSISQSTPIRPATDLPIESLPRKYHAPPNTLNEQTTPDKDQQEQKNDYYIPHIPKEAKSQNRVFNTHTAVQYPQSRNEANPAAGMSIPVLIREISHSYQSSSNALEIQDGGENYPTNTNMLIFRDPAVSLIEDAELVTDNRLDTSYEVMPMLNRIQDQSSSYAPSHEEIRDPDTNFNKADLTAAASQSKTLKPKETTRPTPTKEVSTIIPVLITNNLGRQHHTQLTSNAHATENGEVNYPTNTTIPKPDTAADEHLYTSPEVTPTADRFQNHGQLSRDAQHYAGEISDPNARPPTMIDYIDYPLDLTKPNPNKDKLPTKIVQPNVAPNNSIEILTVPAGHTTTMHSDSEKGAPPQERLPTTYVAKKNIDVSGTTPDDNSTKSTENLEDSRANNIISTNDCSVSLEKSNPMNRFNIQSDGSEESPSFWNGDTLTVTNKKVTDCRYNQEPIYKSALNPKLKLPFPQGAQQAWAYHE